MRRVAILLVTTLAVTACLGSDFEDSLQGAWELESGERDGQQIAIVATHPITLNIDGEQIGGTAACNSYGGTFRLSGTAFSLGEIASTEMACMPPEVMISEQAFFEAMWVADTIEIVDDRLVLSGPGMTMAFTHLDPVPTAELTGTVWVLDSLVQEDVVSSVAGERATLELFTDGSFIGSTGCRDISGSYQVIGAEVQFTSFGAEGSCPEDLADQDSRVITALGDGFRVEIDGDRLTTWIPGDEGLIYHAEG